MTKKEFEGLPSHFQLIESQVQFGDSKASLLVAGNAILLAINGGLIKILSGCLTDVSIACINPSLSLCLALLAGFLLILSIVLALLAARPASIHKAPSKQLYLFSYIAQLKEEEFIKDYTETSEQQFHEDALKDIHGKSVFAANKFKLLRWSIDGTLISLCIIVIAIVIEIGEKVYL